MGENRIRLSLEEPVSIREKVHAVVREDILNGRLSPAERMVKTHLSEEIHASRTPVREALYLLEKACGNVFHAWAIG